MSGIGMILCLAASLAVQGQPAIEPPFKTVNGSFFALSIPDMAASTQWYSEKLGLTVVLQMPMQNRSAVTVLEGGGLIVELIQHLDARPKPAPAATRPELLHGMFKVGIVVKHFEKTLSQLQERGVEIAFGPFPASDSQRANVLVRDNAGNLIQIFGE